MPGVLPRIFYFNVIQQAETVLVPSSELTAMPRGRLKFPLRSDVWRTLSGWTFKDPNKRLDFTEDGNARVATVVLNTYSVGADVATQAQSAMNAAPGVTNTYTVTYDGGTQKFTIARSTGTAVLVLKFGDGANLASSIHPDLGFTDTNKTGGTSYTAEQVSYQSRHFIHADLGQEFDLAVGAVINHNLLPAGTIRLDVHSSSMLTSGLGSAPGGAFSQVLQGDASLRHAYFASESKQFVRLVISDVQNPAGYGEIGIAFVGPEAILVGFSPDVTDDREELSEIAYAVNGANFQTERQTRRGWTVLFASRDDADKVALVQIQDAVKVGRPFFFDFDFADPDIRYVFLDSGLAFTSAETVPVTWDVEMRLREALG